MMGGIVHGVVAPSFSFGHFLRTRWARMEASNSGADADSQTGGGLMDTNLGRSQQRWLVLVPPLKYNHAMASNRGWTNSVRPYRQPCIQGRHLPSPPLRVSGIQHRV